MPSRDFDAALDAALEEPVTFTLAGQTLQCVPVDDLPWKAGMRLERDAENDPEGAVEAFMREALIESDRERWGLVSETVSLRQLKQLLEWLVEVYAGRPTSRPRGSTPPSVNGGQTSKAASSSTAAPSAG